MKTQRKDEMVQHQLNQWFNHLTKDISLKQVEEITGVHFTHISRIKSGQRNATIDNLHKICRHKGENLHIDMRIGGFYVA